MGCCLCRPGGGVYNSDAAEDPSSSSRRIAPNSNRTSQSHANDPHPADLAARNNKALRPLPPHSRAVILDPNRDPNAPAVPITWTRARLERERNDWWDTRTEGQRTIWDAYRTCVEALQRGDVQNAQAILDAAGCTCPSGELWRRIFGPDGVEYSVSGYKWVVLEPVGLVEDDSAEALAGPVGVVGLDGAESIPIESMSRKHSDADDDRPASIAVKCRLSDTARDHVVELPGDATVGELVQILHKELGYDDQNLSVAFGGKRYGPHAIVDDFYSPDMVIIIMVQPHLEF